MRIPKPVTIDFETRGIEGRPDYPPSPVGVSIKYWGKAPRYYGWGHPTENNSTKDQAVAALRQAWKEPDGILCHHAKFDVAVACEQLGLPMLKWQYIHDTLYLLFLMNPHARELSLKPSAVEYLDMPPDEQEAVRDWLLQHQPLRLSGIKISISKTSDHYWGRYICLAPGKLVGIYANGDTDRTERLFRKLYSTIHEQGMMEAYDRERRLMPHLLAAERVGIYVDKKRLARDVGQYQSVQIRIDDWIKKQLRVTDINLDSGDQLADALIAAGKADQSKMGVTAGGKIQTNKAAITAGVSDTRLAAVLQYRARLNTCLHTFMEPWLETSNKSSGKIFTNWNSTRQERGGGARTGRLTSSPNFQNMANEFDPMFHHEKPGLPKAPFELLSLPMVRSYIVPDPGEIFIDRDYSQQEPRILGHFEGGPLFQAYMDNPWIDMHDLAQIELRRFGMYYERKPVKNTNLGLIYGMGAALLAQKNGMTVEEADKLKKAILKLFPGLKDMYKDMKARAAANEPVRTWGGRLYYCEEPKIVKGRLRQFDYKLVNVLVQGSAADCTKEAVIRYCEAAEHGRFLLTVHDQTTCSVAKSKMKAEMKILKDSMESVQFTVPMLSEGKIGFNWADMKDYDKKGVACAR